MSCQTRAPITGAIIKGKISTNRKNFESQFSSFSNKAMPSPSSISTPVAQNAYCRVIETECQKSGLVNVSTKLPKPMRLKSELLRVRSVKE